MNDRERILCLLSGNLPDRVPWFGDLAYLAAAMEARGQVPEDWQQTEDYYDYHRDARVGFYLQGYFAGRPIYSSKLAFETNTDGQLETQIIHTPAGDLRSVWSYSTESYSSAPIKRMVESLEDLHALCALQENTTFAPDTQEALRRRPWVADLGIVLCYLPRSPFMELVAMLAGIDNIVSLWMTCRDEFEHTLSVMEQSFDRAAEAALAVPADCFMIPENLSSEVVGKRFYRDYVQPWETKWVERLRQAGKPSFIHMDGTLRGLIGEVAETGFDVIEACTPAPVGDVALQDIRGMVRPETIIWGGIPGVYFTPLVSDAEFERHVREVLEVMVADEHMVLGIADQAPPDTLPERIGRVAELVDDAGHY